jgi:release factor H-coupled RctB family protein
MASLRLNICKNGSLKDVKPVVIKKDQGWDELLKMGSNKLRIKAKIIFDEYGNELLPENLTDGTINEKTLLIFSATNEFVGFKKEKEDKNKRIVGLTEEQKENLLDAAQKHYECTVRVISKESLIEDDAIKQLNFTSNLPYMRYSVGLPDLHPGKGYPVGSANASEATIYPHLVGADIGCGMSLYKTSLKAKKEKSVDAWYDALHGLEGGWEGDLKTFMESRGVEPTEFDSTSLGTIGGGNHFAELQIIESIKDEEAAKKMGLDPEYLYLLVHSGSRAFGELVLQRHLDKHGVKGVAEGSEEAKVYLKDHDHALAWAKCNRTLLAHRFLSQITGFAIDPALNNSLDKDITSDGSERILDVWHNCVTPVNFYFEEDGTPVDKAIENDPKQQVIESEKKIVAKQYWLHRKGAAPSTEGPVVIPGSRGSFSYLVMPAQDKAHQQLSAFSLAHGAGRKWNRSKALQTGQGLRKKDNDFTTTDLGSRVICESKELLFEEMPAAYKEIENIVSDLQEFGLVSIVAVFRPLITYKMRVIKYDK